ncbi:hypothetical protein IGQ_04595, partial [Bacillus cereus IS195]
AQKKAEEEARKKAEEEAKKQQEQQQNTGEDTPHADGNVVTTES